MAANVDLKTMRTEVRRHANMENSTFVTDAEINSKLNAALRQLYNAIIEADATQYYAQSTFTTTSGVDSYDELPSDFYKLRSVDISDGSNQITARKYQEYERNLYKTYPYYAVGWPVRYRLEGDSFKLVPTPQGAYTVTLNYYPTFQKLCSDCESFDGVNGWEEYAIWKAVAYCLAKEESDASFAEQQAAELMAEIKQMAATRDAGEPEKAVDIYAIPTGWRR